MWKFSPRRKRDPTTDCDRFHESAVVLRTLLSPPQIIDHKPHLVQIVVPCSARREQMRVVAVSEVLLLYWPAVVPLYLKITCCCCGDNRRALKKCRPHFVTHCCSARRTQMKCRLYRDSTHVVIQQRSILFAAVSFLPLLRKRPHESRLIKPVGKPP